MLKRYQCGKTTSFLLISVFMVLVMAGTSWAEMLAMEVNQDVPHSAAQDIADAGLNTVVIYYKPFRSAEDQAIVKHLEEWGAQAAARKLDILVRIDTAAPLDAIADTKTLDYRAAASDDGYPMHYKPAPDYAPFWQSAVFPKIDMLAQMAATYPIKGVILNLSGHISVTYDLATLNEFFELIELDADPASMDPRLRKGFLEEKGFLVQFENFQEDRIYRIVKEYVAKLHESAPGFEILLGSHKDNPVHRGFLRALKEEQPSGLMAIHTATTGIWSTENVPAWDVDWAAQVSVQDYQPDELAAMAGYMKLWTKGFLVSDAAVLWRDLKDVNINHWPLSGTAEYLAAIAGATSSGQEDADRFRAIIDFISDRVVKKNSGAPRVALIYSGYMGYMFRDVFDAAMEEFNIKADKFENNKLDDLIAKIGDYDLVLTAPGYNAVKSDQFLAFTADILDFVKNGGLLFILDASSKPQTQWLGDADPMLALTAENAGGANPASVNASSRMIGFPTIMKKMPMGKNHFSELSDSWTPLAMDSAGKPYVVEQLYGHGMIIAFTDFEIDPAFFENAWEYMLRVKDRFNVRIDHHMQPLGVGENLIPFIASTFGGERSLKVRADILSQDRETQVSELNITLTPEAGARFEVPLTATTGGLYSVNLTFVDESMNRMDKRVSFSFLAPDAYEVEAEKSYYTSEKEAVVRVICRRLAGCGEAVVRVLLESSDGNDLTQGGELESKPGEYYFSLPIGELAPGEYQTLASIEPASGPETVITTVLKKLPPSECVETKILNFRGRLLEVDGEPFYPIGVYSIPPENMAEMADLGVNAMIYYGSSVENEANINAAVQGKGIKFGAYGVSPHHRIYTEDPAALEAEIRAKAANDNMFMWYLADEPELFGQSSDLIYEVYSYVKNIDPYRPQSIVMMSPDQFAEYTRASDIFMFDRYPSRASYQESVGFYAQRAVQAVYGLKPVFAIPACFSWSVWDGSFREGMEHKPNYVEMRLSAFQSVAADVRGIIYWAFTASRYDIRKFPDHLANFKKVMAELASLEKVLMESNALVRIAISPDLMGVDYGAKIHDGKLYIFAYNTDTAARENVSFTLPEEMAERTITVLGENRTIAMQGKSFTDSFALHGTHLYVVDVGER